MGFCCFLKLKHSHVYLVAKVLQGDCGVSLPVFTCHPGDLRVWFLSCRVF